MTQMLGASIGSLCSEFTEVREKTLNIFRPLNVEDAVIQSDVFGSPPNWHLAHTTWFFQKILEKHNIKLELKQQINTE